VASSLRAAYRVRFLPFSEATAKGAAYLLWQLKTLPFRAWMKARMRVPKEALAFLKVRAGKA
jgi:hypothetical protein